MFSATKKGKLVNFDYQIFFPPAIITSTAFASSVFVSTFGTAFYHEWHFLIGYATLIDSE